MFAITLQLACIALISALVANNHAVHAADVDVLNYALTLEHLENAFYRDGIDLLSKDIKKMNMRGKKRYMRLYTRLMSIRDHEQAHVDTLTKVISSLGGKPVRECKYNFGYKNGADFLAIGRILENVGVSAYTGAAYQIVNPALLTAAATITTIEARHASFLNNFEMVDPFPNAFDSPLDMKAIIGLAGPFIVSCPDNITITPYPAVSVVSKAPAKHGSMIKLGGKFGSSSNGPRYCVFYSGSASANSTLQSSDNTTASCMVPMGAAKGDNFLFVMTSQAYSLTGNGAGILSGPALLAVG